MSAEYDRAARRHFGQLFHEHRALGTQIVDHVLVVYDLVTHVDRCAVQAQGALDDLDGAVDSGAEAAWFGEDDLHGQFRALCRLYASGSRGAFSVQATQSLIIDSIAPTAAAPDRREGAAGCPRSATPLRR